MKQHPTVRVPALTPAAVSAGSPAAVHGNVHRSDLHRSPLHRSPLHRSDLHRGDLHRGDLHPDPARPPGVHQSPAPAHPRGRAPSRGLSRAGFVCGGTLLLAGHVAITAFALLVAGGHVTLDLAAAFDRDPGMPTLQIDLTSIGVTPGEQRHVVYLNREGATLEGGDDDSRRNTSSVVAAAGLARYEVPAFRGSAARWEAVTKCVREQFAAYDVEVVDRRPVSGRYVMVMIGGEAAELQTAGREGERLNGLGPLGDSPIHEAVAFVFAHTLKENAKDVCATIAHEVGHAYGLDHTRDCKGVMSYDKCGPKSFRDTDALCGEHSDRQCHDGAETQNSHEELLRVLGRKPDQDLVS